MGLADRVLPNHVSRAQKLENKLRVYMQNRKLVLRQCDLAMVNGDITSAHELKRLNDKLLEESAAVEKELIGFYLERQKRDKEARNEERKNVLMVANRLESLSGNPKVVEKIRKNA